MRRKDREIQGKESMQVLIRGAYGTLSTVGEDGMPYGIPLNYVVMGDKIYIHCAKEGKKLRNIAFCDRVSFCVVGKAEVVPEEFSTNYESVIVYGRASHVEGVEKEEALFGFIEKYSPDCLEEGRRYVGRMSGATAVLGIEIEQLTGKRRDGIPRHG